MKNAMRTVLFSFLLMYTATASAQIMSGMTAAKVSRISTGGSEVENRTGQAIHFYMSCDGENWERVDLAANKVGTFSCSSSEPYIKIVSDGGTVKYKLSSYTTYKLYYDASRRMFDLSR